MGLENSVLEVVADSDGDWYAALSRSENSKRDTPRCKSRFGQRRARWICRVPRLYRIQRERVAEPAKDNAKGTYSWYCFIDVAVPCLTSFVLAIRPPILGTYLSVNTPVWQIVAVKAKCYDARGSLSSDFHDTAHKVSDDGCIGYDQSELSETAAQTAQHTSVWVLMAQPSSRNLSELSRCRSGWRTNPAAGHFVMHPERLSCDGMGVAEKLR